MFELLSNPARYRDVLWIRHFVCDCGVHRTTPSALFMLKRKVLCLLEDRIRSSACEWRIDRHCRRDCVPLKVQTSSAFRWKVMGLPL